MMARPRLADRSPGPEPVGPAGLVLRACRCASAASAVLGSVGRSA